MKSYLLRTCAVFLVLCSCSNTDDQEIEELRTEVEALQSQLDEIEEPEPQDVGGIPEGIETVPPSFVAPKNSLLKDYEDSKREREMRELHADVEQMKWDKIQSDAQQTFKELEQEKCARNIGIGLDC